MILFINTSEFDQVQFALVGDKLKSKLYSLPHNKPSETLKYLSRFLGKKKLEGVEKIIVVSGPGSFSGIRVGISIVQAFAFAKQIPAFAVSKDHLPQDLREIAKIKKLRKITSSFDPDYGTEPNITMSKKHYS
jgi:hypothetical protein